MHTDKFNSDKKYTKDSNQKTIGLSFKGLKEI